MRESLKAGLGEKRMYSAWPLRQAEHIVRHPGESDRYKVVHGHVAFGFHRLVDRPVKYVTVLRDPIDRFVSWMFHQGGFNGTGSVWDSPHRSMHQWGHNAMCRWLAGFDDIKDYCHGVNFDQVKPFENPPWMLEKALENIDRHFLYVGDLSNAKAAFEFLWGYLGDAVIPRIENKSRTRGAYTLSDSDLSRVVEANQLDIGLYGVFKGGKAIGQHAAS